MILIFGHSAIQTSPTTPRWTAWPDLSCVSDRPCWLHQSLVWRARKGGISRSCPSQRSLHNLSFPHCLFDNAWCAGLMWPYTCLLAKLICSHEPVIESTRWHEWSGKQSVSQSCTQNSPPGKRCKQLSPRHSLPFRLTRRSFFILLITIMPTAIFFM